MKSMTIKKSALALFVLQLVFIFGAYAHADLACLAATGGCCETGPAPMGYVYRSYGENLAKPNSAAFLKTRLYDNYGVKVGFEESSATADPNVIAHKFALNCGDTLKLEFTADTAVVEILPVDTAVVAAFPELAPFLDNPNAQIRILSGNSLKTDPGVISWKGTGVFKDVNYVETRCVYLALVENSIFRVLSAVGCHWFIGFKEVE